jgi:hypothetical protein
VPVEFDEVEVMKNMPPSWVTDTMRENERKKMNRDQLQQHTQDDVN